MKKAESNLLNVIKDYRLNELPEQVVYCKRCVNSNQRPGYKFDKEGVCEACRYAEEKERNINWEQRERELQVLTGKFRSKDGRHDVIVPASGGKDSCFVAHQLKYKYGMHPLCAMWAPAMFTDIGWKNLQSFTQRFDTILYFPNRELHRKLTRLGFELWGDPFEPWHYGQRAFPLHMAIRHRIPLVVYGEKTEIEYGGGSHGKYTPLDSDTDRKIQKKRLRVDELVEDGLKYGILKPEDIEPQTMLMYKYPPEEEMDKLNIQVHWFNYYKRWIPQENYYYARQYCGFEPCPERTEGTHTKYASLDDKIDGLHFYMQFIKLGFGRCTSDAAQEIRTGHITREEGVALVKKYDGEFPGKYHRECLEYMGISEDYFRKTVDKWRQPHLWEKVNGEWKLKHQVS